MSWVCKENPGAKIKIPNWRFWILSDSSKVSQRFKLQSKKKKKKTNLPVFFFCCSSGIFYALYLRDKYIFILKNSTGGASGKKSSVGWVGQTEMPWDTAEAAGSGINLCTSKSSISSIWLGLHFIQDDFLLNGEIPVMMTPPVEEVASQIYLSQPSWKHP